eukprot:scaffold130517_cov58-Attheya_sp.AAC.6
MDAFQGLAGFMLPPPSSPTSPPRDRTTGNVKTAWAFASAASPSDEQVIIRPCRVTMILPVATAVASNPLLEMWRLSPLPVTRKQSHSRERQCASPRATSPVSPIRSRPCSPLGLHSVFESASVPFDTEIKSVASPSSVMENSPPLHLFSSDEEKLSRDYHTPFLLEQRSFSSSSGPYSSIASSFSYESKYHKECLRCRSGDSRSVGVGPERLRRVHYDDEAHYEGFPSSLSPCIGGAFPRSALSHRSRDTRCSVSATTVSNPDPTIRNVHASKFAATSGLSPPVSSNESQLALEKEIGGEIDMKFVAKFDHAFNLFISLNPHLLAQVEPEYIEKLRRNHLLQHLREALKEDTKVEDELKEMQREKEESQQNLQRKMMRCIKERSTRELKWRSRIQREAAKVRDVHPVFDMLVESVRRAKREQILRQDTERKAQRLRDSILIGLHDDDDDEEYDEDAGNAVVLHRPLSLSPRGSPPPKKVDFFEGAQGLVHFVTGKHLSSKITLTKTGIELSEMEDEVRRYQISNASLGLQILEVQEEIRIQEAKTKRFDQTESLLLELDEDFLQMLDAKHSLNMAEKAVARASSLAAQAYR